MLQRLLILLCLCVPAFAQQNIVVGTLVPYAQGSIAQTRNGQTLQTGPINAVGTFQMTVDSPLTQTFYLTAPSGSVYAPFSVTVTLNPGTTNITAELIAAMPIPNPFIIPALQVTTDAVTVNGVHYFWPLIQAAGPLCNDGNGNLTWSGCGGAGSFTALTGDASSTSTGGATTVLGLKGVPFCTGFTPTNGQAVEYTTASSPNPCYTAAAGGGITALTGDVTASGTGSVSATVVKVNGATVPASAKALASNSSNQLVAATVAGAGAGLTTGPTSSTNLDCANFTGTAGQVADSGSPCGTATLPTASAAGQIITASGAGTSYAAQGQVFYSQSSDTISTIESECSSLCTYVVTIPQTLTIAANHTLSSNVQVQFNAGGQWTVNGSTFTLTIPGNVQGTLNRHFSGSASVVFDARQAIVPVEWFGAIGYTTVAAAVSGTDSTVAIQNALNAITAGCGQLQALAYRVTAALSITISNVGICGTSPGWTEGSYGILPNNTSIIISTSASADIVDVAGNSTNSIAWNRFTDFALERSLTPTGTATGLSINFVQSALVRNVASTDSVRCFYVHADSSVPPGGFVNTAAGWGYNGFIEASGTLYGYYLDSADGEAENSFLIHDSGVFSNLSTTPVTYGMILTGAAVNDVSTFNFQTAGVSYGQVVNYTGSGGSFATQDIHFVNGIHDEVGIAAYLIQNVTAATQGSLTIMDGWVNLIPAATGSGAIDIESSVNVLVTGVQIKNLTAGVPSIYAHTSSALQLVANDIYGNSATSNNGIVLDGTTASTVSANKVSTVGDAIVLVNTSSGNAITGNALSHNAIGIDLLSSSGSNTGFQSNSFTTVTTAVSDTSGVTTNQINSFSGATSGGFTGPVNINATLATGPSDLAYFKVVGNDTLGIVTGRFEAPSASGAAQFYLQNDSGTGTGLFLGGSTISPSWYQNNLVLFNNIATGGLRLRAGGVIDMYPGTIGTPATAAFSLGTDQSATFGGTTNLLEITAPSGVANHDLFWADSTAHRLKMNNNNGGAVQVVASGGDINTSDQVVQIEGAAIPASAAVVSTNSSKQLTASTAHQTSLPLACADSSGSGTAQSCTTAPSFTPASGDWILYTTTTANTGDVTVNVDALGAKHIRKWLGSSVLVSGDMPANTPMLMVYDGTYWEVPTIGNVPSGGGSAWSALTNPTNNLGLTMAAYTSTFTYNAATGSGDLFGLTDTTSNTGTGIMQHIHTQSGSTEIPWQADANGVGWKVNAAGVLQGVGSGSSHGMSSPEGTAIAGASATDTLWADSIDHRWKMSNNNGTATDVVGFSDLASSSLFGVVECGSGVTCSAGVISVTGGGMVYPGAGIAVSTGSAWGTSLTAPSSAIVGVSDTQTLTNKTVDGVSPTTMGYLDATSSVQTQLNGKASSSASTTVNSQTCALGSTCTITTTRTVEFAFGTPGGSALSTGVLGYKRMPYACTGLASWSITVDAGTATMKTWKVATGTAIPTTSNSISTSGVSISTGTNVTSPTVSDFTTTTTSAGDVFGFDLSAASGVGSIDFELTYTGCTL